MAGENSSNRPAESAVNAGEAKSDSTGCESGLMLKAGAGAEEIMTRAEVAQLLRCSEPHVSALVERDGLPAFRLGKLWRFKRSEVLAWCERRTNAKSER
jgi:excisionase family DNA binding protein